MERGNLAGGWLSGRYRKDNTSGPASAARPAARFDMSTPANQRKLDAVEQLAALAEESGLTLIELAVALVINHPGVPGVTVNPADNSYGDFELRTDQRRR
ncbi:MULTISPECIES: aldo/keto reductase [unclassified Streptomyces]|uniref:aldo/keto reductase n=1 Tax=unclassified Streptomyces TaxID=2593676 RepID=UPI0031BAAB95